MDQYNLKLFVAGDTLSSKRAVINLRRFCDEELAGRYTLEIIDVLQNPQAAEDARILATPTLLRVEPSPPRRIVGDLSDKQQVLLGLDLDPQTGQ